MGSAGRRRRGGEIGDEGGRGTGEEGVKVEGEILAAAGGTGSGAASDDLVGVGGAEERIEVVSRMRGADGAEGGKDDGGVAAAEVDAAGKVFLYLLGVAGGEDGVAIEGGGGEVGGE